MTASLVEAYSIRSRTLLPGGMYSRSTHEDGAAREGSSRRM